jgi:GTPase SAR1 family protein
MAVIAIVGRGKVGKSTFLNSLLEFDLFPVDALPCNNVVIRANYGPAPSAHVVLVGEDDRASKEIPVATIPDWATEEGNPGNRKRVARVLVRCPSPLLQHHELVDLPGEGSLETAHDDTLRRGVEGCEAAILLFDARQGLQRAEWNLLDLLVQQRKTVLCVLANTRHESVDSPGEGRITRESIPPEDYPRLRRDSEEKIRRIFAPAQPPPLVYTDVCQFGRDRLGAMVASLLRLVPVKPGVPSEIAPGPRTFDERREETYLGLLACMAQADGKVSIEECGVIAERVLARFAKGTTMREGGLRLAEAIRTPQDPWALVASWRALASPGGSADLWADLQLVAGADGEFSESEWKLYRQIVSSLGPGGVPAADHRPPGGAATTAPRGAVSAGDPSATAGPSDSVPNGWTKTVERMAHVPRGYRLLHLGGRRPPKWQSGARYLHVFFDGSYVEGRFLDAALAEIGPLGVGMREPDGGFFLILDTNEIGTRITWSEEEQRLLVDGRNVSFEAYAPMVGE